MTTPSVSRLNEIATEIRTAHVTAILYIGQRLIEAQELFRYDRNEGGFTGWVDANLTFSVSSAYDMMAIAKRFGDENVSNLWKLSRTALLELAHKSTPEPVIEQVQERAASGERITAAEIKRLKQRAAEADTAEAAQRALRDVNRQLTQRVGELEEEIDRAAEPKTITVRHDPGDREERYGAFLAHWRSLPADLQTRFLAEMTRPAEDAVAEGIDGFVTGEVVEFSDGGTAAMVVVETNELQDPGEVAEADHDDSEDRRDGDRDRDAEGRGPGAGAGHRGDADAGEAAGREAGGRSPLPEEAPRGGAGTDHGNGAPGSGVNEIPFGLIRSPKVMEQEAARRNGRAS